MQTATRNSAPHCTFRTPSGRFCRLPIAEPGSLLCFRHTLEDKKATDAAHITTVLTTDCDDFTTAMGIHNSLAELYKLLAADLISARRAAVLAYIANLLLRTIPIVHSELDAKSSEEPFTVDVSLDSPPRPNRDPQFAPANHGTFPTPPAYSSATAPTVPVRPEEVCS